MRRGVAGAARPQVQVHDPGQQERLVPQVARVPGPGQARRADALGFGQVPGIGQHDGQHRAARPGERAGDPGRDLPGLPGQPHRLVMIAGIIGVETELDQGQHLPGRVPDLPGQRQRTAGIAGRLGGPAHQPQYRRPAGQGGGQRPGRRPARDGVPDRGEMAERCGQIGRELRCPAEPELRGAPPAAARLGAAGGLAEQPVLTGQPAPQEPPPAQRVGQPQRDRRIVLHRPGQRLPHGGVLGIEPAGRGQLTVAGLQPGRGLPGHPQRVPGQRGGGAVLLPGLGQQPGPVGAQRLQHRVPGPAIRPGPRRGQQRAVHQPQHRRHRRPARRPPRPPPA